METILPPLAGYGRGRGVALAPPEQGHDITGAVPAAASRQHEVLLGLEEDLGGPLQRAVDAQPLPVLAIHLATAVNDPSPHVGRNHLDGPHAAFFDGVQLFTGFAPVVA